MMLVFFNGYATWYQSLYVAVNFGWDDEGRHPMDVDPIGGGSQVYVQEGDLDT